MACRATKGGFIETRVRRKAGGCWDIDGCNNCTRLLIDGDDDGDNGADSDEGDGDGDDGGDDLQSADHQGADCDDGEGGL